MCERINVRGEGHLENKNIIRCSELRVHCLPTRAHSLASNIDVDEVVRGDSSNYHMEQYRIGERPQPLQVCTC